MPKAKVTTLTRTASGTFNEWADWSAILGPLTVEEACEHIESGHEHHNEDGSRTQIGCFKDENFYGWGHVYRTLNPNVFIRVCEASA